MVTRSAIRAGWLPLWAATFVVLGAGCQQTPPDTRDADLASLRQADSAFAAAASAKDLNALIAFYADDAAMMMANAPATIGREAIQKAFGDMLAAPDFSISWQATGADVSRSGDLGYTVGAYQLTVAGPKGKPVSDKGKYVTVWRKQADGTWKVVIDTANSDLPAGQ